MHAIAPQILKRQAAERQDAAVKRARQRAAGRRVSFAPEEDLVTTQLYALVRPWHGKQGGSGPGWEIQPRIMGHAVV